MDMERMIYPNPTQVKIDVIQHLRKAAEFLTLEHLTRTHPSNVAACLLRETYVGGSMLADYVASSLGEHLVETLGLTEARLDWDPDESVWLVHHLAMEQETFYGGYNSYAEMLQAMATSGGMAVFASDGAWERIRQLDLMDTPGAEQLTGEPLVERIREIMRGAGASIRGGGRAGELAALAIYRASGQFAYKDLTPKEQGL